MAEKRIDWSPRHGPVSGSINTALGLGAFTAANDAFTWGVSPWWAVGLAGQTMAFLDGRVPSIVMAASGRRVPELEWDLLMLIRPKTS